MAERSAAPATTERITVALTRRVASDLDYLQELTEQSKTDLTNRAISLYRLVTEELAQGAKLAFIDPSTKDLRTVEILG